MPHDPLQTLLRVRRIAVEDGRRVLAASLDASTVATDALRQAERAITLEIERASEPGGSDNLVEAFAAWLPGAKRRVAQARDWQGRQEAEVSRCRADLNACRQALEMLEQLCTERKAAADKERSRQEVLRIDEAASRPRPDPL